MCGAWRSQSGKITIEGIVQTLRASLASTSVIDITAECKEGADIVGEAKAEFVLGNASDGRIFTA